MIKRGDRVLIKSLDWYEENKDASGNVNVPNLFVSDMTRYCGQIREVSDVYGNTIYLKDTDYMWSKEMFEDIFPSYTDLSIDGLIAELSSKVQKTDSSPFPNTYRKCCKVLGIVPSAPYDDVLSKFVQLRTIRDAYWNIGSCQPDWTNMEQKKFVIITVKGKVVKETVVGDDCKYFAFTDEKARDFLYDCFSELLTDCKNFL